MWVHVCELDRAVFIYIESNANRVSGVLICSVHLTSCFDVSGE